MTSHSLPSPTTEWLGDITTPPNPSKATREDDLNYNVVSLCPPAIKRLLLRAINVVVHEGPPANWSASRVCLLYKKGDPRKAENYRPICLIQILVKLAAAWPCKHLTAATQQHSLLHGCQHGGLAGHRCGEHVYDVVSRMLQSKGRLYHLYIDFNKAFNSVLLKALWKTLEGYGLLQQLIDSIRRLYTHSYDHRLIEGVTTKGHLQERGVRQGCPLSPLLFILYLNLMFFYLDTKIQWGLEKRIHAFVDDILFWARSIEDIKTVFEAFDGPARELGLDMNVGKTELHAMRGSAQTEIHSCHGASIATWDSTGSPHKVYKYLGVDFFTSDQGQKILEFIKSEIRSFFTHLAPIGLTASELIMLCNKQLQPNIAFRLLAGPLTDAELHSVEQCIWPNLAIHGKLPRSLSAKNRHAGRAQGSLNLTAFKVFMHTQIFNYSMRYLQGDGPRQSNQWVRQARTTARANWLQNAFVDAVYALGGRCHGFGEWNPCPTSQLTSGECIHVEFSNGWFTGTVQHYDQHAAASIVKFDIDHTLFSVKDKIHNFAEHTPRGGGPEGPPLSLHHLLAPLLLTPPLPLPPYPFPDSSQYIDAVPQGQVFGYPRPPAALQVHALLAWDCTSVAMAAPHPDAHNWVWVYLDRSWDNPWSGSAAIIVWPDGTTLGLAIPCPYHSSKNSEFLAFIQATRYLQSVGTRGTVFFCVDNAQIVQCDDAYISGSSRPPPSTSTQGTWQVAVADLLDSVNLHSGIGCLKAHVGFQGNVMADALAKYTGYAVRVLHIHRQLPSLHSVTFGKSPVIHKFGGSQKMSLYPRHQHTGIHIKTSFDWSSSYSWFSAFADKWVMGVKGVKGAAPHFDLAERKCPDCGHQHPLDLTSCVAFCDQFRPFLHQMADAWGPSIAPNVHSWLRGNRTKGEMRNFARTLVPLTLYSALAPDKNLLGALYDALPERNKRLTAVCKSVCLHRESYPLPDPLPPPLTANTFYDSHGTFSTSDRPPPSPPYTRTHPLLLSPSR